MITGNAIGLPTVVLHPGYVCVPPAPARLCVVAAAGVAVTVYDRFRRRGGMGYYLHPRRRRGHSSTLFAAPAIVSLLEAFLGSGSRAEHLETGLYGGAENPDAPGYDPGRALANIAVAREVMRKMGVLPGATDIGGFRARKVAFHTESGETMVARVTIVRSADWYPPLPV